MAAPRPPRAAPGSKSTLEANHRFPAFYACYLLKSVRTATSTATYIGSTPNPPRRLRQHNRELTAGAWKTARGRPWAMQMLVHGFPSKLAALQFEWAWQHPHRSRHLRDAADPSGGSKLGAKAVSVRGNIRVVRAMLATHPYTTWPLHVKLFTQDAVRCWTAAASSSSHSLLTPASPSKPKRAKSKKVSSEITEQDLTANMPRGLTVRIELEGVDGKSGSASTLEIGTGREKRGTPIEVTDAQFTSAHLEKHTALLTRVTPLVCTVCRGSISPSTPDPGPAPMSTSTSTSSPDAHLALALCPTPTCTSTSHLACLAPLFLRAEAEAAGEVRAGTGISALIPRGGACPKCGEYVLWGDVVRGCYRRLVAGAGGRVVPDEEEDEVEEDNTGLGSSADEAQSRASPPKKARTKASAKDKGKGKNKSKDPPPSPKARTKRTTGASSSEKRKGEGKEASKVKGKGTRKTVPASRRSKASKSQHQGEDVEGEFFDLDVSGSDSESDNISGLGKFKGGLKRTGTS